MFLGSIFDKEMCVMVPSFLL